MEIAHVSDNNIHAYAEKTGTKAIDAGATVNKHSKCCKLLHKLNKGIEWNNIPQPKFLGSAARCRDIIGARYVGSADQCPSSYNIILPSHLASANPSNNILQPKKLCSAAQCKNIICLTCLGLAE